MTEAAPELAPALLPPAKGNGVEDGWTCAVPVIPGRLGAYDVQKPVGKGGYAIVYKAIRQEDGRVCAIKKVEVSRQEVWEGGWGTCGARACLQEGLMGICGLADI